MTQGLRGRRGRTEGSEGSDPTPALCHVSERGYTVNAKRARTYRASTGPGTTVDAIDIDEGRTGGAGQSDSAVSGEPSGKRARELRRTEWNVRRKRTETKAKSHRERALCDTTVIECSYSVVYPSCSACLLRFLHSSGSIAAIAAYTAAHTHSQYQHCVDPRPHLTREHIHGCII